MSPETSFRLVSVALVGATVAAFVAWIRSWRRRRVARRAQAQAFAEALGWKWRVGGLSLLVSLDGSEAARRGSMVEMEARTYHGRTRWRLAANGRGPSWVIEVLPRGNFSTFHNGAAAATGEPSLDADIEVYASDAAHVRGVLTSPAVREALAAYDFGAVRTGRLASSEQVMQFLWLRYEDGEVSVLEPGFGRDEASWRRALRLAEALAAAVEAQAA